MSKVNWISTDSLDGTVSIMTTVCTACSFRWVGGALAECPACEAARERLARAKLEEQKNLGSSAWRYTRKFKFNVNDDFEFRPTKEGCQVLKAHGFEAVPGELKRLQAWSFMQKFGPSIYLGGPVLFLKNNVVIKGEDLALDGGHS